MPAKDSRSFIVSSKKTFLAFCEIFLQQFNRNYPSLKDSNPSTDPMREWLHLKRVLEETAGTIRTASSHRNIKLSDERFPPLFAKAVQSDFGIRFFGGTLKDLHEIIYIGSMGMGLGSQGRQCCDGFFCQIKTDQSAFFESIKRTKVLTEHHHKTLEELKLACDTNDLERVKYLISPIRAHLNSPPYLQLVLEACEKRKPSLIRLFVENGVSLVDIPLNGEGGQRYLHPKALKQLLDAGMEVTRQGLRKLCEARYDLAVVLFLYGFHCPEMKAQINDSFGLFLEHDQLLRMRQDLERRLGIHGSSSRKDKIRLCNSCAGILRNRMGGELWERLFRINNHLTGARERRWKASYANALLSMPMGMHRAH